MVTKVQGSHIQRAFSELDFDNCKKCQVIVFVAEFRVQERVCSQTSCVQTLKREFLNLSKPFQKPIQKPFKADLLPKVKIEGQN